MSDTRAPEMDHEEVSATEPVPESSVPESSVPEPVSEEAVAGRAPRARRSPRVESGSFAGGVDVDAPPEPGAPRGVENGSEEEPDGPEDDGDEEAAESSDRPSRNGSRRSGVSLRRLEEEGEVAADYLEELLDIVDLDGDIDIDVENGRASVAIVAEPSAVRDLRRLVGSNGEVLEALQELARLAVQARTGERSRLMLDVVGHRAARRQALVGVATRACEDVVRTGAAVRLDPMSAFERKVVHDVVAEAGLVSESDGEEPGRRVVILPADA